MKSFLWHLSVPSLSGELSALKHVVSISSVSVLARLTVISESCSFQALLFCFHYLLFSYFVFLHSPFCRHHSLFILVANKREALCFFPFGFVSALHMMCVSGGVVVIHLS